MSSLHSAAVSATGEIAALAATNARWPELNSATVRAMLVEAFAKGALWGIERTQHAVAITHARYQTEAKE